MKKVFITAGFLLLSHSAFALSVCGTEFNNLNRIFDVTGPDRSGASGMQRLSYILAINGFGSGNQQEQSVKLCVYSPGKIAMVLSDTILGDKVFLMK